MQETSRVFDTGVGRFLFFKSTPLSHCKLVRDAVMGEISKQTRGNKKIRNGADATQYIRNNLDGSVSHTVFSFYPKQVV